MNALRLASLYFLTALHTTGVGAGELRVVATSKPIHSLIAAVMEGVGSPVLLVDGMNSPHTFALKPSGAAAVNKAEVFFRVSGTIEPFSEKIVASLPRSVAVVTLAETPGLTLFDVRRGATFDEHEQHDAHDDPAQAHHAVADHDDHDHNHGSTDGHVWLDPANAKLIARNVAQVLVVKDPAHAQAYQANADKLADKIDEMSSAISQRLGAVAGRPFIVFHDATQYFERRFGLSAAGSITVSPQVQPSAQRLSALRRKITTLGATCVFSEPLFQPRLMATVTEGTRARSRSLDPEGLLLQPGPGLYFTLMTGLADAMKDCLAAHS